MKNIIKKFQDYLYAHLGLSGGKPKVREQINNEFVDYVFHTNSKNIILGSSCMTLVYVTLLIGESTISLHIWLISTYIYYSARYVHLQCYNKGQFLGIKWKTKRLSDLYVALNGSILGLLSAVLYYIVSSPPYSSLSELIVILAILIFTTAALSLNSNLPLWCFAYIFSLILPMDIIMISKGGIYIMGGLIIGYYGFFIYKINLKYYLLYYSSSLYKYENKKYLEELHASQAQLKQLVEDLKKNNKELTSEVHLRKKVEKKIRRLASTDILTGVTNRISLEEEMLKAIQNARRTNTIVGVLFIDLDRFKYINDTFGHGVGDELLKAVATRLTNSIRSTDQISRIGGDEFVLLLTNIHTPEALLATAQNILMTLDKPYQIEEKSIISNISMGISFYPQNGDDPENLIRDADVAMYSAKEIGGNSLSFFTQEMNEFMDRRLKVERMLQKAIEINGFQFLFQPIVCLKTGIIISAEVLIRFQDFITKDTGYIGPSEFIPIAEDTRMISKIGVWGIEEVCRILKRWDQLGYNNLKIALNISVKHVIEPNFISQLTSIVISSGINPSLLILEITETQDIENREFVKTILEKVTEMGIKLSVDDFGTGHSNFCYLRELPISKIKIDRSFMKEWNLNKNAKPLIDAIISVSKALSLEAVAEGVETLEQLEFLKKKNCGYAQGYYFSKPLSEEDFLTQVERGSYFSKRQDGQSPMPEYLELIERGKEL